MGVEYFLSYRFTGEDPRVLAQVLGRVAGSLRASGHQVFCSIELEEWFRGQSWDAGRIYAYCLERMDTTDRLLVLVRSAEKSTGIAKEVARARELGKPIALAVHQGVPDTFLTEAYGLSRTTCLRAVEYRTVDDLCESVRSF